MNPSMLEKELRTSKVKEGYLFKRTRILQQW